MGSNTAFCYHRIIKKVLNQAAPMNYLFRDPYSSFKFSRNDDLQDFLALQEVEKFIKKFSILGKFFSQRGADALQNPSQINKYISLFKLKCNYLVLNSDEDFIEVRQRILALHFSKK
jgi:hypothetical protein